MFKKCVSLSILAILDVIELVSGIVPLLPGDIERLCDRWQVVPTIVDKVPTHAVQVMFGDGVLVKFGNEIDERLVKEEPNVKWVFETNETYYTLLMVDPDNPTRIDPINREFQHWLIGNIPGDMEDLGEEFSPWYPPHPIKACGLHRYTFVVFKQPGGKKIKFDEPKLNNSIYNRARFDTKKFAKKYNLGDAVAINFFLTESYLG